MENRHEKQNLSVDSALLVGSALVMPPAMPAAEKDMMKDEKGMMEKGMKDDEGMMKEGKDATKEKMKEEKSGKGCRMTR